MKMAKSNIFRRLSSLFPPFPTSFRSPYSSKPSRQFCSSSSELLRRFGCSDGELSEIFFRLPSLHKANHTILSSKLTLLSALGLTSSDLVKIVNCRPRFLNYRIIGPSMDERIDFLHHLFETKEMLLKAITRNPSLLLYDLNHMKNCFSQYERFGITKQELVPMLISRPALIPRTSFDDEKLDYINRIGLSNNSKMYKYIVCLVAVSRLDTIREKMTNFEKFGVPSDQVVSLFRKSPLILTLSVDKVQRNMTFVIGTLKLPAIIVLQQPFLLYANLESVLRPRYLVGEKIKWMGLNPQIIGPDLLRALRMTERRFFKVFIDCHSQDVSNDLMELYTKAKGTKRLAETSRRNSSYKTFPF